MSLLRRLLVAGFATGAMFTPLLAQEQSAAALCDELAASPYDPETPEGKGILFEDIEPISAIEACLDAAKADPENAKLRFQLGTAYDAAEDYEKAHLHYNKAMDGGSLIATAMLGQLYEFGLGVDTDEARAAELYQPAAEAHVRVAVESLAKLYEDGRGVEQSYEKAAALYKEASDAGSYWAMGALGWLTENGWGVSKDEAEAVRLYQPAADAGIDFAQNNLGTFYAEGLGGLDKDPAEAVRYYTMAADQGLVRAYINLGLHYSDGNGVKKNVGTAEEYFRKALDEGDAEQVANASNNLAWLLAEETTRFDEAEELARAAVAALPAQSDYVDTLAWVLHRAGRNAEALPLVEQAIVLDPSDDDFKTHRDAIKAALEE